MSIIIPESKIPTRINASANLIRRFKKTINCIRDSTTKTTDFVILGTDGLSRDKNKFKISSSFYGSYKEVWNLQNSNNFVLVKIYFHLYNIDLEELIALHCDLDSNPATAKHKYKIHPHLHVKCAKYDFISKAHFSLCLLDHKITISKLENLENMYKSFFDLVNYELIR